MGQVEKKLRNHTKGRIGKPICKPTSKGWKYCLEDTANDADHVRDCPMAMERAKRFTNCPMDTEEKSRNCWKNFCNQTRTRGCEAWDVCNGVGDRMRVENDPNCLEACKGEDGKECPAHKAKECNYLPCDLWEQCRRLPEKKYKLCARYDALRPWNTNVRYL